MPWLLLYNIFFPFFVLGFLVLGLFGKRRRAFVSELLSLESWKERLGQAKGLAEAQLWFHAASLGEVKCLEKLLKKTPTPFFPVHLTTMTQAGKTWAKENYLKTGLVGSVALLPLDWRPIISFYLKKMQNLKALILVETELWPNLIVGAKRRKFKLALINARLSFKSLRWLKNLPNLATKLFSLFDVIGVSSEENMRNFRALGCDESKLILTGNLKWDLEPSAWLLDKNKQLELRQKLGFGEDDFLFVAGSTHSGEEEILLEAFKNLSPKYPSLRWIVASRHLERVFQIHRLIHLSPLTHGLSSKITVVNQFGLLINFYAIADSIFIGGTLVPRIGGHNFLEAATLAKPIIMGPYFENFKEEGNFFIREKALKIAASAKELQNTLESFILDPKEREGLANQALKCFQALQGATSKTMELLPYP